MSHSKSWYVGVVIMRSSSTSPTYRSLYEESLILVRAENDSMAMAAVEENVESQLTTTFKNEAGEEIVWALETIVEVKKRDDSPGDGVEIYSRFFRDYEAYRRFEPRLDGSLD